MNLQLFPTIEGRINAMIVGLLVATIAAGSSIASAELRAYAANTMFSADILDGQWLDQL